jgi:hypothetical protein
LLPGSSIAEFYKYRDENGIVRYTDNPLEIPEDQQKSAKEYREIKIIEAADGAAKVEGMDDIEKKLRAEKETLDKEYKELAEERKKLEEEAETNRTEAEQAAYQNRIRDFNLRLKQYEEKRLLFKEKADVYNETRKAEFK